jgi:hypothetical protein
MDEAHFNPSDSFNFYFLKKLQSENRLKPIKKLFENLFNYYFFAVYFSFPEFKLIK